MTDADPKKRSTTGGATYLSSLTLSHVRCFGPEQTLDLTVDGQRPARWSVILGDNGVGKTTLLQCLVALEPARHYFKTAFGGRQQPTVELPTRDMDWRIYRDPDDPGKTRIRGAVALGDRLTADPGHHRRVEVEVPTSAASAPRLTLQGQDEARNLVCYGYGANRRMGSVKFSDNGASDPAASLFSDDVSLIDVEEWLLGADYEAHRTSEEGAHRFEAMTRIITDLLPDAQGLGILENRSTGRPAVAVLTPYGRVLLDQLSLGYRTMTAWAVDLASRLFQRCPESLQPLAEPIVVLVDEIDLHLHPRWQRALFQFFTTKFPNAQFVVTAHSPLVVQALEDANIILLRREGDHVIIDNDVEAVRGWRVDQVLTSDLFGLENARPPNYDGLLAKRKELLEKRMLTEADRADLKQLEAEMAQLPAGESLEDWKAMEVIRRAARSAINVSRRTSSP